MITVKQVRAELGLSQGQFASLLGVHPARVSNLENNTEGRRETKKDRQMLKALIILHKNGLLQELADFPE